MRKGNLELIKSKGKNKRFEIVKWYFYEKENKELNCIIYFIEDGIPEFIGDRPFEMSNEKEFKDSLFLLRKSISKSKKYKL